MAAKENTTPVNKYSELRNIDVSEHIEKKNGFSYLSWAWAVDQVSLIDPEWSWEFAQRETFEDGTVMVYCDVTIFGKTRRSYLPVIDYKNNPIAKPNAMQINTTMQRCLVKGIALHGLGLYIYAGEDLPESVKQETQITDAHKMTQRDYFYAINSAETEWDVDSILERINDDALPEFMKEALRDGANNVRSQIENGVARTPAKFGFIGVPEAVGFAKTANETIQKAKDIPALSEWMNDNDHKLRALDVTLTAAKYQSEEGSPYQRIVKKYSEKLNQLKPAERIAAE